MENINNNNALQSSTTPGDLGALINHLFENYQEVREMCPVPDQFKWAYSNNKTEECIKLFHLFPDVITPLLPKATAYAAEHGWNELLQWLLHHDRFQDLTQIFHHSVKQVLDGASNYDGALDTCTILLQHGVNPNNMHKSTTVLEIICCSDRAEACKRPELLKLVLQYDADPSLKTTFMDCDTRRKECLYTPIVHIVQSVDVDMMRVLIANCNSLDLSASLSTDRICFPAFAEIMTAFDSSPDLDVRKFLNLLFVYDVKYEFAVYHVGDGDVERMDPTRRLREMAPATKTLRILNNEVLTLLEDYKELQS